MTVQGQEGAAVEAVRRVNLVLTRCEQACLAAAARALRVTTSQLMCTAALEAAHRLGYYEGHKAPARPRPGAWQDVPCRPAEVSATRRLTVTVAPLHLGTLERAAREQTAKAICHECAVRGVCLEQALNTREPFGIWGGLTEQERRVLLDSRG